MKSSWLLQLLILLVFLNISLAEQRGRDGGPTFGFFRFHVFFNRTQSHSHHRRFQDTQLRLSPPTVLSGVLCFIAASISSAGSAHQQEDSVFFFLVCFKKTFMKYCRNFFRWDWRRRAFHPNSDNNCWPGPQDSLKLLGLHGHRRLGRECHLQFPVHKEPQVRGQVPYRL